MTYSALLAEHELHENRVLQMQTEFCKQKQLQQDFTVFFSFPYRACWKGATVLQVSHLCCWSCLPAKQVSRVLNAHKVSACLMTYQTKLQTSAGPALRDQTDHRAV